MDGCAMDGCLRRRTKDLAGWAKKCQKRYLWKRNFRYFHRNSASHGRDCRKTRTGKAGQIEGYPEVARSIEYQYSTTVSILLFLSCLQLLERVVYRTYNTTVLIGREKSFRDRFRGCGVPVVRVAQKK